MKKYLLLLLSAVIVFAGCGKKEELPAGTHKVEVVETINASSYTYMRVDENGNEYWIAVPQMQAEKGDVFYFSKSLEMQNFSSPTMNRTFDKILFVEDISKTLTKENKTAGQKGMNPHSQVMSNKRDVKVDHLKDGQTVEQIYKDKEAFSGKEVKIIGVVTKYNPGILDRNWVHIQDGTGSGQDYDLIVTTKDETAEGKTVVITGTVALNKDFGNGYAYSVLVENASIKEE